METLERDEKEKAARTGRLPSSFNLHRPLRSPMTTRSKVIRLIRCRSPYICRESRRRFIAATTGNDNPHRLLLKFFLCLLRHAYHMAALTGPKRPSNDHFRVAALHMIDSARAVPVSGMAHRVAVYTVTLCQPRAENRACRRGTHPMAQDVCRFVTRPASSPRKSGRRRARGPS